MTRHLITDGIHMQASGAQAAPAAVCVATFYRFVALPDYRELAGSLRLQAERLGLQGTIILAEEGINATLAGSPDTIDDWFRILNKDQRFAEITPRLSETPDMPFYRLKVKVRKEIVTMGEPGVSPLRGTGVQVDPQDWDELIADPEVLVIDARNVYETRLGSFQNAVDPGTDSFREFPAYVARHLDPHKHRKVAMFCTGGIRCEKASAWMLEQGFDEVYQLSGGILNYLEQQTAEDGRWRGACFLFDQRVGVGYGLARSSVEICYGCRQPLTPEDLQSSEYEEGVSCPYCAPDLDDARRASLRERHRQEMLARKRGARHIGNRQT